jgi:galactokinase
MPGVYSATMSADLAQLTQAFEQSYGRPPQLIAEAPGRVNLIGEHTDYNLGFVLPVAIDRTVAVAAAPRGDPVIRVHALDFEARDEFRWDTVRRFPGGGWRSYPRAVAWSLAEAGHGLIGADITIAGDVPPGAGLSSSAATELAAAGALAELAGLSIPPRELAIICQRAENAFVGVRSGIMDQFASALGVAGHALLIDCRSLEVEPVALPDEDIAIVVADSNVPRTLADTAYNQRRAECAEAARILGIESLRDADLAMLDARHAALPDDVFRRARHVVTENARVLQAADALRRDDLQTLGELMYGSHESLRADFQVSVPELDLLVELARATGGVLGSRLTGAGFGGCTVSLVRSQALEDFRRQVVSAYRERTGLEAAMHVCRAVDGLKVSHV